MFKGSNVTVRVSCLSISNNKRRGYVRRWNEINPQKNGGDDRNVTGVVDLQQ